MATYRAELCWERGDQAFSDQRYSRKHRLRFDGGIEVDASSSPHLVPLPMSDAAAVDPEELFVAALSSCHMLWFLSIAAEQGYVVDRYDDQAEGEMRRNANRKFVMTVVTLRPTVRWAGTRQPDREQVAELHHRAHEECFIANSVLTEVRCEPVFAD